MSTSIPKGRPDVWARLSALSFDLPGAALPFSARLARDNGWTEEYAERALEEYRRFAYLATVSGAPVTPSDEVDQVWHLHLCYTRHYWGPFKDALGQALHHGPTEGGAAQGQLFRRQYDDTLALYRAEFGEEPPRDLWPAPSVRFGKAPTARRVLTADHWVIRKPSRKAVTASAAAAMTIALPGLAAASAGGGLRGLAASIWAEYTIPVIMVAGGLLFFLIALILSKAFGSKNGSQGSGCGAGGIHTGDGGDGGSGCGSGCGGCGGG